MPGGDFPTGPGAEKKQQAAGAGMRAVLGVAGAGRGDTHFGLKAALARSVRNSLKRPPWSMPISSVPNASTNVTRTRPCQEAATASHDTAHRYLVLNVPLPAPHPTAPSLEPSGDPSEHM